MLVSVVSPVFNVSEYLRRGIDAVLAQSFQDFELILVDDGSTDDSGRICDDYATFDNRIRVIHKKNGGVCSARNAGLDLAKGEWVYFIDPDDVLLPDGLSTLVSGISDEVDAVLGGYEEIRTDGTLVREVFSSSEHRFLGKSQSLRPLFVPYSPEFGYVGHACLRLYRMDVIQRNRIRFDEAYHYCEGRLFNASYICLSRGTTCFILKPIYNYCHRESSLVMSLNKGFDKKYLTAFDADLEIIRLIKDTDSVAPGILLCARNQVIDRYRIIKRMLKKFDIKDKKLLWRLRIKSIRELGIPFIASLFLGKFKKRIRSCVNNG